MPPSDHAVLGASSSARWLACPGSIRLSQGIPSSSSSYAREGTAAHTLAERCLLQRKDPRFFLGEVLNGFEVTEEMAEAVQVYVDTVRADQKKYTKKGGVLSIETKFRLDWLHPNMWGTNDASLSVLEDILFVYDYKHGAGIPVEVEDNSQLKYYGLGAIGGAKLKYKTVELVIVQPRCFHEDGPVRRWSISCGDLLFWGRSKLKFGASRTAEPAAPLAAGKHCKFCPALATCPEQHKQANAVAKTVFASKPSAPPPPEALTPEEMRQVLDKADLVEKWFNAIRAYAKDALEKGTIEPEELGYKMVRGRRTRRWANEKEVANWLDSLLDEDEIYAPRKLCTPAQVEKLVKGKSMKEALKDFVTETQKPQLAPLSDKREAIRARAPAAKAFDVFLEG